MSSSPPESLTVRAATEADAPRVAALANASEVAVRGESDLGPGDVREWWRTTDLVHNTWVLEQGEEIVAAATLWAHGEIPNVWADVHPDYTGRGLGTRLAELTESRARELGAAVIRNDVFEQDRRARRLLESRGYRDVRRYFEMRIDLGAEPPPEPRVPDGLTLEEFRLDDARAFHAALTEAFADEWGFVALPFDDWRALRVDVEGFDPSLWAVVRDGDEIAAVVRNDPHMYGGGWVGALGVRKLWRRRGLGLALLQHTFRVFHARGVRRVALGVDAENPTGATRLYERAGMHIVLQTVEYERPLG